MVSNSTFFNCVANAAGGGVYIQRLGESICTSKVFSSSFLNCTAALGGGVVFILGRPSVSGRQVFSIEQSMFHFVTAVLGGGAVDVEALELLDSADVFISGSTFVNCTSAYMGEAVGGAMRVSLQGNAMNNNFMLSNNTFKGCTADHGGAIHLETTGLLTINQTLLIDGCIFSDCQARIGYGGGIYWYLPNAAEGFKISLQNSKFSDCSAVRGGAFAIVSSWAIKSFFVYVFQTDFLRCASSIGYGNALAISSVATDCHVELEEVFVTSSGAYEGIDVVLHNSVATSMTNTLWLKNYDYDQFLLSESIQLVGYSYICTNELPPAQKKNCTGVFLLQC
jgi:hypothetical protein